MQVHNVVNIEHAIYQCFHYGKVWKDGEYATCALFNIFINGDQGERVIPLNSRRKTPWKTAIREFICYLRGYTNVKDFQALNCKTWDANSRNTAWLSNPWCKGDGDLGRIYGAQLIDWQKPNGKSFNQLQKLIDDLSTHKDHRGNYVTFWNPGEFEMMALRPCMHSHQFTIIDGKLHLTSFSRSMDAALGGVANVIQCWFFLWFMCKVTGLEFGTWGIMVNNLHIYNNQLPTVERELDDLPTNRGDAIMTWDYPTDITLDLLMRDDVTKYMEISGYQSERIIVHPFTTTKVR